MKNHATLLDRRSAVGALLSMAVPACSLTSSFKSISKINQELNRELGVKNSVEISWVNGKKRVRVMLVEKPALKPEVIRKKVHTIATRHIADLDEVEVIGEI